MDILKLIIPGLVAIVGNIIFYLIIKSNIDKSIERFKISYTGIHKEKIDIHKEILKKLYQIKQKVQKYYYTGDEKLGEELFTDFNDFINYYLVHQPFINKSILNGLKKIKEELQSCFDDFYKYIYLSKKERIEPKMRVDALNKLYESGNKFKLDKPFSELEELIINEIKTDLEIK